MTEFVEISGGRYIADYHYGRYGAYTFFPQEDFLSFKEAKEFIRKLGLKSQKEWKEYCRSGKKPDNVTAVPDRVYKNKGWISWGDFLGTGYVATFNRVFLSFKEAREFVRKLKFKSKTEWAEYSSSGKRPDNITSNPRAVYKDEWQGWGDFLGTGNICSRDRVFLSFEEAREFIRSLKLSGDRGWREYCKPDKKPYDIPTNPNLIYKDDGWTTWGDWFGTGYVHKKDFLPFKEAREFARSLKLKNYNEWKAYLKSDKRPDNIPTAPNVIYKDEGWIGIADWLETGRPPKGIFLPFDEARKFVRKLKIKSKTEWIKYWEINKKPDNIPLYPYSVYRYKGWTSFGDFLGSGYINCKDRIYLSFEEAKKFAISLGLKDQLKWREYCKSGKKPDNISASPQKTYKNKGWTNWGNFLGTGRSPRGRNFLPFDEAKKFVRKLKFQNKLGWDEYAKSGKRPLNIPSNPGNIYKDEGWINWYDFLGMKKKAA